jgi:hypothetical protein
LGDRRSYPAVGGKSIHQLWCYKAFPAGPLRELMPMYDQHRYPDAIGGGAGVEYEHLNDISIVVF